MFDVSVSPKLGFSDKCIALEVCPSFEPSTCSFYVLSKYQKETIAFVVLVDCQQSRRIRKALLMLNILLILPRET